MARSASGVEKLKALGFEGHENLVLGPGGAGAGAVGARGPGTAGSGLQSCESTGNRFAGTVLTYCDRSTSAKAGSSAALLRSDCCAARWRSASTCSLDSLGIDDRINRFKFSAQTQAVRDSVLCTF